MYTSTLIVDIGSNLDLSFLSRIHTKKASTTVFINFLNVEKEKSYKQQHREISERHSSNS